MKHSHILGASALALVIAAPAAQAITPDEVWANWQALTAASGATITAAGTATNGAALDVTGITVAQTNAELGSSFTATIEKMTFTDRGDGSVAVTMSDAIPVMLAIPEEPGDAPAQIGLTVGHPGMVLVASGDAAATTYDYTAPTMALALTSLTLPDGTSPDVKAEATGTTLAGRYVVGTDGEKTTVASTATIAMLAYAVSGSDPATSATFAVKGSVADLAAESTSVLLGAEAMKDVAAALKAGFAVDSRITTGAIDFAVDGADPTGPVTATGKFAGTDFGIQLDQNRVAYGFGLTGGAFDGSGPGLPGPVGSTFGEVALRLALPMAQTADPQDFSAAVRLVDLTLSDSVWALAGPAATLPRDPMTLIVDLKGGMAWLVDILAPGAMESSAMPIALHNLDINEVLARAFGAEVTALGGLTFDNSDLVTFGGIPAPTGKVTVNMKGINALIETLVSMGMIPEDQVMGARMMLAMFAKPGAGADELVSEIEFKDKGLFVNGQQLQ